MKTSVNKKYLIVMGIIMLLQPVFLSGQAFLPMQADDLFSALDRAFDRLEYTPTPKDEYYLGRAVAANILDYYKPYTANPELTDYLNFICKALVINSSYQSTYNGYQAVILNSREFNAFATPSGHIFITRGLIEAAPSEDALAGIIAHELAHIMLRHGMKMIEDMYIFEEIDLAAGQAAAFSGNLNSNILAFRDSVNDLFYTMARNGYSVPQELEADTCAAGLLADAGYSPRGLLEMLNVLQRIQRTQAGGFNSTHPSPARRITNLESQVRLYRTPYANAARRERFEQIMGWD